MFCQRASDSDGYSSIILVFSFPHHTTIYFQRRPADPREYKSSLRVTVSPALFNRRLMDNPVNTIDTDTRPTAISGSAPGPSIVASASETSTSRIIGETMIKLMIV